MPITVNINDRGTPRKVVMQAGWTLADALSHIGYHRSGHEFWTLWENGHQVALHTIANRDMNVTLLHIAAGSPLPATT